MNIKYFLKGFFCIKSADSPAIALFASFIAIGALFKSIGLNIQESIFSTFLTYALPGSLIMAESLIVGASLLNIFLAVWLVNARLYPMTVSLFPLLTHKNQPRFKYYLACHFIAVSAWLAMKTIQMSLAVILGSFLGIIFYFISPEWCILLGGFTAGTLAFFIGELNGN